MTGRLSAASTSATSDGDEERDVISHPAPTSCIHVPTFDTIVAIHRPRKRPLFSGLQADGTMGAASGDFCCFAGVDVMATEQGWQALQDTGAPVRRRRRLHRWRHPRV